jgi:hypothetical protein
VIGTATARARPLLPFAARHLVAIRCRLLKPEVRGGLLVLWRVCLVAEWEVCWGCRVMSNKETTGGLRVKANQAPWGWPQASCSGTPVGGGDGGKLAWRWLMADGRSQGMLLLGIGIGHARSQPGFPISQLRATAYHALLYYILRARYQQGPFPRIGGVRRVPKRPGGSVALRNKIITGGTG